MNGKKLALPKVDTHAFVDKILSLQLVENFYELSKEEQAKIFKKIPQSFSSGAEYECLWRTLFYYETYNQLISTSGSCLKNEADPKMA